MFSQVAIHEINPTNLRTGLVVVIDRILIKAVHTVPAY